MTAKVLEFPVQEDELEGLARDINAEEDRYAEVQGERFRRAKAICRERKIKFMVWVRENVRNITHRQVNYLMSGKSGGVSQRKNGTRVPILPEEPAPLSEFEHEGMTCEPIEISTMRIPPKVKKAVERLSAIADKRIQRALLNVLYMEPGDRNQVCYILENLWIKSDDKQNQAPTSGTGA